MLLTSLMIGAACSSVSVYANHQDACNKFLEVSTKKVGIYQTDEKIESYYTDNVNAVVKNNVGSVPLEIAGASVYAYKVYKNKSVGFRLPTMGLADSASNNITPNSYSLNLTWKFPSLK